MRRHGLIGVFLCVFAIWTQVMASVVAVALDSEASRGVGVICAHDGVAPSTSDHGKAPPQAPRHHHCLLCQACFSGALLPERPAFTALDYPVSSPLRWRFDARACSIATGHDPGQPRGPPSLV